MAGFVDACRFNPTAGGTSAWTYSSAVTGYQSPALAGVVNGTLYKYRAESADLSQWEIGEGAYNTGTGVLARTTVLYNSSGTGTASGQSGAGTAINFTTTPQVAIVALAEDLPGLALANSFTNATAATNTTTGALKVAGGVGVQGDVFARTLTPIVSSATAWGIDFSPNTVTVPGSSSVALATGSGLVMLVDSTSTGQTGLYLIGGGVTSSAALLAGGSAYVAPTVTPAASKYSVGFDSATTNTWRIYNGNTSPITFCIGLIRARNTD